MRPNDHRWLSVTKVSAWTDQDGRCTYCLSRLTRLEATADHREPRSRGGSNRRSNIACACTMCNRAKGSTSEARFRNLIKQRSGAPLDILFIGVVRRINLETQRAVKRILAFAR